jgi:prepilin-type N-terminal cleavage/methylation domain-containing protein
MFLFKRNFKKINICSAQICKSGFTLIELLVTITIFSILTGVVLFNQQKFNSTILLTNLAYDTALTIRQAQTYGINIKEFNDGEGGDDSSRFVPYGVHFNTASKQSFILFADLTYNHTDNTSTGLYSKSLSSCSSNDGCVNRYNITRGNYIKDICAGEVPDGSSDCGLLENLSDLSISYKRPNPNAIIRYNDMTGDNLSVATIILAGVDGESTRKVRVWESGLIEIIN